MKFPTNARIREVRGNHIMAREFYLTAVKGKQKAKEIFTISLDNIVEQKQVKVEPVEGIVKVKLDEWGKWKE